MHEGHSNRSISARKVRKKTSPSIEMPPHKLLIDTDVPEARLRAIGALRELEKVLRI